MIYYTVEGESKVSEETVNSYAAFLEDLIKNYKKSYGLDFKFEPYNGSWDPGVMNGFTQLDRVANLLKNNDIDPKYLDTAMPVYLINLDDIGVPAFYTHAPRGNIYARAGAGYWAASWSEGADIVSRNQATTMGTTYTFPYISINSAEEDIDNAKALAAHELFHHYQDYICGEGKYGNCKSGLFTTETTANVGSIHNSGINKVGTTIGQHAAYVARNKLYENSIDKVYSGYGAYQFGYNYTKMVPDGTNKTWESMKTTEPLKYLYDNSNGKYKDVLLTTAEKNLTLDYDKKMLLPYIIDYPWKPIYQTAHSDINVNQVEKINYSSMHYYYAKPSELSNTKTFFKALKEKTSELTLLFFINEDGTRYKKVYSQPLDKEFVIKYSDWLDYEELAFAIVETSIDNNDAYYSIDTNPTLKYEATVTPESLGLKKPDQSKRRTHSIMCYQVEDDDMFKEVYQVLVNLDKDEKINNMMMKGTLQIKNYDENSAAYKLAKNAASGVIYGIKLTYKSKLKYVKMKTYDKGDTYSILFNVTKNYDEAFKGSFNITPNGRQSIIEAIEAQGFVCE